MSTNNYIDELRSIIRQNNTLYAQEKTKLENIIRQKNIEINQLMEAVSQLNKLATDLITHNSTLEAFLYQLGHYYTVESFPKKSGIYVYHNIKTNEIYVGQSVDMNRRLKQHFRNGKLKIDGHDSEFKNETEWRFYVAEFISRNDKKLLDEREAYWIAKSKNLSRDKTIYNKKDITNLKEALQNNATYEAIALNTKVNKRYEKAQATAVNRTLGNNIKN